MTGAVPHSPQPWSMVFLLLCAPVIALGGWIVARRSVRDEALATVLVPGIACAAWLLAVHVASLGTRSFTIGLPSGTIGVAAAAAVILAVARRSGEPLLPPRRALPSRSCCIATALATLLFLPAALGWSFHDELFHAGHMATASQIENGHYPPRHGVFGTLLLRYHYGFNLLTAMLASVLRLRVDRAIDVATITGWAYAWVLCWALGERLAGPGRGVWTAVVTLLGGGLAFFDFSAPLTERLLSIADVRATVLNPPLASYFFQHPFALGIPIGLTAVAVYLERRADAWRWTALLMLVLLASLSLSHIVVFTTCLGSLLGAEFLAGRGRLRPRLAVAAGLAVTTVLVARSLGGFFTPQPGVGGASILFDPDGPTGRAGSNLLWNLATFGLLVPLGGGGIWILWRRRRDAALVLGLLVAGSWLVLNLFHYKHSWDVAKFGTMVALGLGLAAGVAIDRILDLRPRLPALAVATALSVTIAIGGVGFLSVFALHLGGVPEYFWKSPDRASAAHVEAVDWLRRHAGTGDVVMTHPSVAAAYAQWGGLPQVYLDTVTDDFGFSPELLLRRQALLRDLPANPDHWLQQGIRWIVVGGQDQALHRLLQAWERQGRVQFATRCQDLLLFRLVDAPAAAAGARGHDPR